MKAVMSNSQTCECVKKGQRAPGRACEKTTSNSDGFRWHLSPSRAMRSGNVSLREPGVGLHRCPVLLTVWLWGRKLPDELTL